MAERSKQISALFWRASNVLGEKCWQPPTDIYRTRTGWLMKFELAGVKPEDIAVELAGSGVRISGIRRDWIVEEGCTHYSLEISYSRFERAVELPGDLEGARFQMDYRDGILLVRVITGGSL